MKVLIKKKWHKFKPGDTPEIGNPEKHLFPAGIAVEYDGEDQEQKALAEYLGREYEKSSAEVDVQEAPKKQEAKK